MNERFNFLLMNKQLKTRVFVRLYYIKCKIKTTTLVVGIIDNTTLVGLRWNIEGLVFRGLKLERNE